jgi:LysM repeat protein
MNTKVYAISLSKSALSGNLVRLLLALSLVLAMLAMAANPARAEAATEGGGTEATVLCSTYHTVARGETLYRIGLKYGVSWKLIAEANKLKDANKIYTGQVLCIPGESTEGAMYVQVKKIDVNIRKGPGMSYKVLGILRSWQTALILGKSSDGGWYQIVCPSGISGECWVTANSKYVDVIVIGDKDPGDTETIPTISIKSVVEDTSVTIRTANFPKNTDFVVRMGRYGTQGVNGVYVTTVNSGKGGEQTFKFTIPASLTERGRIAIRLESANGYYAYNWFYNTTAK